jgi:hypothetical protein
MQRCSRPPRLAEDRSARWAFEPAAGGGMKLRVRIGGVDQYIGVDGEH